jgi:hypothetical protein
VLAQEVHGEEGVQARRVVEVGLHLERVLGRQWWRRVLRAQRVPEGVEAALRVRVEPAAVAVGRFRTRVTVLGSML